MRPLRVSLVTPSFNHARFIERTIDSVLSQRGDFELDYRVLDGGSTDGTIDVLQRYGDRVQWISERDKGQVDAINKGLRRATGDIVGWLNSDDVLLPGALERVVTAFRQNPTTDWVHGRCLIIDEHDNEVRKWISAYKHYRAQRYSLQSLLTENFVSQMTVFWRRHVHDDIGFIDGSFKYAFDYDLWVRLAERTDPVYIEDAIACFRWYETSKSGEGFVVQMTETADRGASAKGASAWTYVSANVKKRAIINIYRALGYARGIAGRFR
ncbi:MAG: glycosyltransferase family 2 protein [Kofleriaceae bacterium]